MSDIDLATQARFSAEMAGDLPIAGLLIQLADALDRSEAEVERLREGYYFRRSRDERLAAVARAEKAEALRWKTAYEMAEPVLAERDRLAAQVQAVRALVDSAALAAPVDNEPYWVSHIRAALEGSAQ